MSLGRHQSRRIIIQTLVSSIIRGDREPDEETLLLTLGDKVMSEKDRVYLLETLTTLKQKRGLLIRRLEKHLETPMTELSVPEQAVLLCGAMEIVYGSESKAPISVALNESVDLAREFGGEKSPALVNAVLRKIAADAAKKEKKLAA